MSEEPESCQGLTIGDQIRAFEEVVNAVLSTSLDEREAAERKLVSMAKELPLIAIQVDKATRQLNRAYAETVREQERTALWRDIAGAVREAAIRFVPFLWQSQTTEYIRTLCRDEDAFEAEVDRRMAEDYEYKGLLIESKSAS